MRRCIPALMLGVICLAAPAPAAAQAEGARALADMVRDFNAKTAEARAEYARTGDYGAYKAKIDPLLKGLKSSLPGAAHSAGGEATDAIIQGMEESRKRKEQ